MLDVVLQLKASYFKNADFCNNNDCPVARAIKKQLNILDPLVLTYSVHMNGLPYKISYWAQDFDADMEAAQLSRYDDSVVRELTLIRVSSIYEFDTTCPYEKN